MKIIDGTAQNSPKRFARQLDPPSSARLWCAAVFSAAFLKVTKSARRASALSSRHNHLQNQKAPAASTALE
jgi:hypothetical protein